MKKLPGLIILTLLIITGCSTTGSKMITEENAPVAAETFDQSGVFSRINELRMGKKPVGKAEEKPSPALSQTGQISNPPPVPEPVELENLMNEYKRAIIKTNLGDITVEFYGAKSPITVNNFLNLAKKGFYNSTKFHRVIKDFMIQGGDPLSKDDSKKAYWGTGDPGYKFQDEINSYPLQRGSLAMANSGPNTNGSQFFIVTADFTPWLDGKHTNFGFVTEGMETVAKIDSVITGENDRPLEDVVVEAIELVK